MSNDPTIPYPPRYRWLRRLTLFYVTLFAAVLLVRLWWGWEAQRNYDAVVADLRARGEPTREEELFDPPVVDGLNMVPLLNEAEAKAVRQTEVRSVLRDDKYVGLSSRQLTSQDREILKDLVSANAAALDAVSRAATRPSVQWTPRSSGNFRQIMRPLVELALILAIEEGRSADAIRMSQEFMQVAQAFDGHPPSFNSALGPVWIESAVCTAMASRLADIRFDKADPHSASHAQIKSFIEYLLEDSQTIRSTVHMYRGERITTLKMHEKMGWPWIVRPLVMSAAADHTHVLDQCSVAAASANFTLAILPRQSVTTRAVTAFAGIRQALLRYTVFDAPYRATVWQCGRLTRRRALAVLLAIHLYTNDHSGQMPATLEELVPQYLPAVPVDPFALDRHSLRYVFDPVNPIVYSVDSNGIDNGGKTYATTDGGELSADLRYPYHAPLRPLPSTVPSSGENDQKQENPGGGND